MMHGHLASLAQLLVAGGRGVLAADEPPAVYNARFPAFGIAPTQERRRAYRELLLGTPDIERYVSAAILHDETMRQSARDGARFADRLRERGIMPGVRVDAGTTPLPFSPGETVTEGLDGLRARLSEYAALGAGFATWRATFRITGVGDGTPSDRAIGANAHASARFAALAQECGLVPFVDAEVLADGDHDVAPCAYAGERVLRRLFAELAEAGVALDAMILQTGMIAPGLDSAQRVTTADVVGETLRVLGATVPVAVAGIAFVSDADAGPDGVERLCAMNKTSPRRRPWPLTFAYGRSLRHAALAAWRGDDDRVSDARRVVLHHAFRHSLAACGAYSEARDRLAALPGAMRVA